MKFPEQLTPKLFTILREGYSLRDFKADLIAGTIVAIVALPLAMALGIACGVSPEKGLITAIIAGGLISLLGGSRVQIGGPTGAFVVVIVDVIAKHGYDGLLIATLLAGVVLIIAGYLRWGGILKFISQPVIVGFTAGIAVVIASTQVKNFLGLQIENVPAAFISKWSAYTSVFHTFSVATMVVGFGSLGLIVLIARFASKIPGFLVALGLFSLIVAFFHLPVETIRSQFPNISSGLAFPHFPPVSFSKIIQVWPSALTIAFLAGVEALLSAVVADGMTGLNIVRIKNLSVKA